MRKYNKLFAILFAVLGVQTLSAQSWTAPIVGVNLSEVNSNTELYMYNVKADAFASSGMSWGTHAIVKELQNGDSKLSADVHRCKVSFPTDGQLQILLNEKTYLGGGGPASTNDCWVDHGNNNVYIYNEVKPNVYTLKPTTATNESYLDCSWAYGGHITFSATNGCGNTEWAFVLRTDITNGKYLLYKAKKEMYDIYEALVAAGHDDTYAEALTTANIAYTDANATAASVNAATKVLLTEVAPALTSGYFTANSLFNNPDMRGYGDDTDWGNGLNDFADGIFESWHSSETITQTQTGLPNGFYTVVFLGMYRQDGGDAAPTLTLSSGGKSSSANLKSLTEIDFGTCNGGNGWTGDNKPDNKYTAGEALAHTDAGVKVENFVVEDGELTVTVAMPSASQWLLCQGFQIFYKAESVEEYANLFYAAKTAAEAVDANTVNTYVKNILATALSNAAAEQISKEWYQSHTEELNNAVALANAVTIPYANVNELLAVCESIVANSEESVDGAKTTFSTAVSTAKTDVEAASTADAINTVYNTLETARQAYVVKADPINETSFDYTFLVVNPAFDEGTTGWLCESDAQNKNIASNKSNGIITGSFFENWKGENFNGTIYQSISGLPSGKYQLKIAAFGSGTYVFANDVTTAVTTADGAWYEVNVVTGDGNLKFGIKNENAINWMGIDNASLRYHGFDVEAAQAEIPTLKAEAEALVGKLMSNDVATALANAISGADATKTTRKELTSMIDELNTTIADAEASIATYELVSGYIAKANTIDESIAAEYQTLYDNRTLVEDAITVFQNLEVATYNYVVDNFTYPVALSNTWNSNGTNTKAADVKGEHWSDDKEYTYKNQYDGWGDPKEGYPANEWSIDFDQEVTLPAGEYVFKVAGRKSVDATLELVVTMGETVLGTVNDFPSTNEALGINKEGAASFDANDPAGFAKEGKGYGWQWRYVKFTLDDEATVKVAVHAETNKIYNWVSFGDYTLQMTEETYLKANQDGLNAAIAAAEELVGTLPMGDAENTALQTAIDMPVTTGAEMLAKVEALNAAVAAANAWVVAYNEAKAPLVAALERFEADYNDAENGALNYLNKGRWTNAVEKAQAAAVAKDVTNSYEGFETATTDLVAALDAATTSINEYADLKAAIENANSIITGGNIGDGPFQRPQSAVDALGTTDDEQAVYDAAEKDGEEVTSLTEALRNGCEIELNAPTEGTRYNMIMVYDGWEHNGKAVTYLKEREDQGLYNIKYHAYTNVNYAQAFTFTAVEGQLNCYTLSMTDVDGNERYVCTGVPYGGNTLQLRTTTNAEEALAVKVIATTTDGIYNLYNTAENNYIGGQDAGFYTVNSHINFNIVAAKKAEVALTISSAKWATLILPFNAELPEGVKAYSCGEADGENLTLVEAESFVANTPYLVSGEAGTYNFSDYGLATKDSYTDGLFTGIYVEYTTTANSNTYVLQNGKEGVAFYRVGESAQPKVKAYRCYMTYEAAAGAPVFRLGGTTGIDNAQTDNVVVVYDLMGRKVSTMEKGNVYIVNGKKVVVK